MNPLRAPEMEYKVANLPAQKLAYSNRSSSLIPSISSSVRVFVNSKTFDQLTAGLHDINDRNPAVNVIYSTTTTTGTWIFLTRCASRPLPLFLFAHLIALK
jgi:hypothetical protein